MEKKLTKAQRKDRHNRELCKLVKENDLLAENRLLMENEGLIVQLASKIEVLYDIDINNWGGVEKADIIQEGRIAMLRAAQTYDEEGNVKFSTYVYTVMENAMKDLCKKGVSAFEKRMIDSGLTQVFLDDEPWNPADGEDDVLLAEKIKSSDNSDPTGNLAVLHVMLEKMRNRLIDLPVRERRLLSYHFGLGTLECRTIGETAAYFHLTEKYISIIEKGALAKLREGMNDYKIV